MFAFEAESGPTPVWRRLDSIDGVDEGVWKGQIGTIVVCPDASVMGGAGSRFLVVTNRGEVMLFRLSGNGLNLERRLEIDLSCNTGRFLQLQSLDGEQKAGFLLGGANRKGQASLMWLEWRDDLGFRKPREIYASGGKGRLRMLQQDPDGEQQIWAIDQERGWLLHWRLDLLRGPVHRNSRLPEPSVWYRSASKIHSLYVSKKSESSQVVCGGHDGLVVSLSRAPGEEGRLLWAVGCGGAIRRLRRTEGGPDGKGYWLIAGDSEHVLILDDQGRLTCVLEHVGPVSATGNFGAGTTVLGAQSGRVLFMTSHELPKPHRNDPLPDNGLYPLRSPHPPAAPLTIIELLQLLRDDEPLIFRWAMRILVQRFKDLAEAELAELETLFAPEEPDDDAGPGTLPATCSEALSPHRTSLLARNPCGIDDGKPNWDQQTAVDSQLLLPIWRGIARRSVNETLCQITDALLTVAGPAAMEGKAVPRRLVTEISNCLWNEEPSESCPRFITHSNRKQMLKLGQAARAWRLAQQEETLFPLAHWTSKLALIWNLRDPDPLWWRFKWLIDSRLPFTGFVHQDPWLRYLGADEKARDVALVGLGALHSFPADGVLREAQVENVKQVFPHSEPWARWVDGIAKALERVNETSRAKPHVAWRERKSLTDLTDSLENAIGLFTPENGLTLAALFWRSQSLHWSRPIEHRQQVLDELAHRELSSYLDVAVHYRWRDQSTVEVQLELRNRSARTLQISRAELDGRPIAEIHNEAIPTSDEQRRLGFVVNTTTPDVLERSLVLICEDHLGRRMDYFLTLNSTRSLEGFINDSWWEVNAKDLMGRLDRREKLLWLRGPWWPDAEHERLENMLQERFSVAWDLDLIEPLDTLEQAMDRDRAIWVPDMRRDLDGPQLIVQVHDLLHQSVNFSVKPMVAGIWLHLRNDTPKEVHRALQNWIPDAETIRSLLRRLLGEAGLERLSQAINAGTTRSCLFTVWCTGNPVDDPQLLKHPPIGDLGVGFWSGLLNSLTDIETTADWIGTSTAQLEAMETKVERTRQLMDLREPTDAGRRKALAAPLLQKLLDSGVDTRQGVPYAQGSLDLLHQTYPFVYVVTQGMNIERGVDGPEPGLWLHLGCPKIPGLPGESLCLDADDVLSLLAAPDRGTARQQLNQRAAVQLEIQPERLFQTRNGLDDIRMERAFHGRREELRTLRFLLDMDPSPTSRNATERHKNSSALLVGGRRIGKTTLLKYLEYELRLQGDQRPFIDFVLLDPLDESGPDLLRWFLLEVKAKLGNQGETLRYEWSDAANTKQKQEAIRVLKTRLRQIRNRGNKFKTVLFLDETQYLLDKDCHQYVLGSLVKELLAEDLITLIATSYPHGSERSDCLYRLNTTDAPNNPWYNLFSEYWLLGPWSPEDTWRFLQPRLAGFGIRLPDTLASPVLELCRGVPWIAHTLGKALCDTPPGRRRLVRPRDWSVARETTLDHIHSTLSDTVNSAANKADREADVNPYTDYDRAFSRGRLFEALAAQARRRKLKPVKPQGDWPEPIKLDAERIVEHFNDRIELSRVVDVLNRLTHTSILEGTDKNTEFLFWNNLFPSTIRYRGSQ